MPHSALSRPDIWQCVDLSLGLQSQLASLFGGVDDDDSAADGSDADGEFEPSVTSNGPSHESDADLSSDYGSINTVEE